MGEVDQLGDCVICKELQNPTEENHNSRDLRVLDFIARRKNYSITNWQNNPIEIYLPNIFSGTSAYICERSLLNYQQQWQYAGNPPLFLKREQLEKS